MKRTLRRRIFLSSLGMLGIGAALARHSGADEPNAAEPTAPAAPPGVAVGAVGPGEDLFTYLERIRGGFDRSLFLALLGAANEFKEGDQAQGIHAADEVSRSRARTLLGNTRIGDLHARPIHRDAVYELSESAVDPVAAERVVGWKMRELKDFLLSADEAAIEALMAGLSSDVVACAVKLMNNEELIAVGRKVFNPLPGSKIGSRGYLGARVQPNSPTDHVDDIRWQVFCAFSYAVGDLMLGTNPVSSEVASVAAIETALQEVVAAFGLAEILPHCVLAHIDVQAAAEAAHPGTTALFFQSLGSTVAANATFDVTVEKMVAYAQSRAGRFGLYFETGQGADATNGHGAGVDMVIPEARK